MSSAAKKLLDDALALPEEERRKIGEALLRSVDAASDLDDAQGAELARRVEKIRRGEGRFLEAEEHLRELRTKLGG